MFDHYIFDLYGTLVDIRTNEKNPYLWEKAALFMTLQGAAYDAKELKSSFREGIDSLCTSAYEDCLKCGSAVSLSEIEADFESLITNLYLRKGVMPTKDMIADWALLFRTLSIRHLCLYNGAVELLNTLRNAGKKVYLLSNAQRLFTEPEMKALGIYGLFDDILYSSDIGYKKPSSLFYQSLLQKHHIAPKHAVMIGNDDQADCWGAHTSGLHSIYIETAQSPKRKHALPEDCEEIKSLADILSNIR